MGKIISWHHLKQYLSFFDHISFLYRKKEVDQIVKYLDLNLEISFSIQINISREPQKSGLLIEELDAFYLYAKERGLTINSIMAIPMKNASTKDNMKELIGIKSKYDLSYISYGMSDDYLDALKYGSDQVRIGSKIFGKMTWYVCYY